MTTVDFIKTDSSSNGDASLSQDKVLTLLKSALAKRFPGDSERQHIVGRLNGKRLNFCCPFCGDSKDPRKKRGNFYTDWLYFKCYNGGCEEYVDIVSFAKKFGVYDNMTDDEKTAAKLLVAAARDSSRAANLKRYELSLDALINTDFTKVLVPRADLMRRLKLQEITPQSQVYVYLHKRLQTVDKKFAWDGYRKRLFIFNLDRSGDWVFALQTRQFENANSAKYLTYNASGMRAKLMGCTDEDLLTELRGLDPISIVFNVLQINFNDNVTLFEGPMDSFLYPNAVGMCSIGNDWPFGTENTRWFQDNDDAGRKKAMVELEAGKSVFLWKKFLEDHGMLGKRIKDYNDLVVYDKAYNLNCLKDVDKCFSTHRYDGIFL